MENKTDNWHRFVWKIENFSYCWHKRTECISSRMIHIEGISWNLQIFPRGNGNSNYIACYLKSLTNLDFQVNFILKCVDIDGNSLAEFSENGLFYITRNTLGSATFVQRNDVFLYKRTKFLPNDTLTVCCYIFNSGKRTGRQNVLARTRIEVDWQTISEKIQNVSSLEILDKIAISIPSASVANPILKITFSLDEGPCFDQILNIEVLFDKNRQGNLSTCTVFLIDADGTKVKCGNSENWFESSKTDQIWRFPLFFTKWELMAKKDSYLPNNSLHLQFEFSFSMGISDVGIEKLDSIAFLDSADSVSTSDSVGESSGLEDLGCLFRENILCDVDLQTATKTFPAHKAILSARSPVFKAMFTSDMKEKTTNRVDIEDLDDETVHRLLLYIYTNTLEDLQWQAASQLYKGADKYSVVSLKKKCSSILKGNLCPSNVCEILDLADRHQDANLKNSVQEYILLHDKSVVGSDEWKDFGVKNPQLAFETICNVFKKAKGF